MRYIGKSEVCTFIKENGSVRGLINRLNKLNPNYPLGDDEHYS